MPNIVPVGCSDLGIEYDHSPDVCPLCHHAVQPNQFLGSLNGVLGKPETYLEIVFKCTHRNCQGLFIGQYWRNEKNPTTGQMVGVFKYVKSVPIKYKKPEIFQEVEEISPIFKKIYSQACEAEALQLDEISGVGFRKALEYLVKDYCIHKNPDKTGDIKSAFLGNVIQNYVDDANFKTCAQRAAWLGKGPFKN